MEGMNRKNGSSRIGQTVLFIAIIIFLSLFPGCSINKFVMNKAGDALSSGTGSVFTSDDDIELVGDALPFALKFYESILESVPNHPGLLLATGRLATTFSFAYVQRPAEMLPPAEIERQLVEFKRAKNLYLRAVRYCMRSLESGHRGFTNSFKGTDLQAVLKKTFVKKADARALYWTGMSWMAAYTMDKFDINLSINSSRAVKLLTRALELDEGMDGGSIHEFFITYFGSLPASMGGSEEKARFHFKRACEISKGTKTGPYLALASSLCVNKQYKNEFVELLNQVIAIDPESDPQNRLLNLVNIDKAKWMLKNEDRFFLSE
jgi:predicted anti-sigma-YlaC factor YlaD